VKSLALLAVVLATLLVTALVSPWVAWGLAAWTPHRFTLARVYDRVFEVLLAAAVAAGWRRLELGTPEAIGFGRARWGRDFGVGLAAGVLGVATGLALCWTFGALLPALRFPWPKTIRKAFLGLAAALAIALGEEALFRGVLLRRVARDLGTPAAVIVTAVVYAVVHVIRARGGHPATGAWSGIEQTLSLGAGLLDPATLPRVGGLALLGSVLAVARLRSGALWLPIGIHAALVATFRVGRLFFSLAPGSPWLVGRGWPPLVGGLGGWVAIGVIAGVVLTTPRRRSAQGQ
jgi:membrane protease YdiL (CAAX protease family)